MQPEIAPVQAEPQVTAPALQPAPKPALPVPSVQTTGAEKQRSAQALIRQVEAAYAAGEANYRKGKLPEAKTDFDRAVDLMLTSGFDIRSEAPLDEEFNRILDAVNGLEMQALKQGNGFVAPVEPTPADVASDVTFEVDPNFVAKAKADLATTKSDLPLVMNDYVAAFINFFANTTRGHYTLLHSFQRSGRYKAMIQRVMAEEGVPQDLIYLAVAESSFNPRAMNPHSHAGGMWQFMPQGNYGLARNAYVDERFDPEKSTRAYARYMKFIYGQLGDWYLSMAGYDWGTGNVQRAVQKTGYADFWELYQRNNLPAETKVYVPEILAAIIIANHPTQYGFDDVPLDPPLLTDTVTINYSADLHLISDIVGAPMEELTALNPSLLRAVTPPDAPFDLHLPAGTAALFEKAIAMVPENKRNAWRYHRVKEGETLASIARDYRVTVADLAEANQLQETASLQGVEALVAPTMPVAAPSARALMYTARKGDTLVTIADRFGVSLDQLRRWNKMTGVKVEAGRRLRVGEAAGAPRSARARRRGASAQRPVESGANAHEEESAPSHRKSTAHTGAPSAAKENNNARTTQKRPSSSPKSSARTARNSHAQSAKPATGAKKSNSSGTAKNASRKNAAKKKSAEK
jgi:membrane-bound lytic murein transglycosylase D